MLEKSCRMSPNSQQGQGIRHRINCMGWCARSSAVLAHTNSSPMLSRGIFSTHRPSSGSQMYFSWRMQQWILDAINMLPVTQHGYLLWYNLGEMLNQLPWLTKLYCFLNEQQCITVFRLVLGTMIIYPIKSEGGTQAASGSMCWFLYAVLWQQDTLQKCIWCFSWHITQYFERKY